MREILLNPSAMVFLVPIVAVVAYFWYEVSKTRSDNELKKRMIERGMSVDEIERVLGAGVKKEGKK